MKKFKVLIHQVETYCIDVNARSVEQAKVEATKYWNAIAENGIHHMYQNGDIENKFGAVYDVTNTDDPFNPLN